MTAPTDPKLEAYISETFDSDRGDAGLWVLLALAFAIALAALSVMPRFLNFITLI